MQVLKTGHAHAVPISERLVSVDVFRGATIAAMLLHAQPGRSFEMFGHAEWIGWTFTDCIAPCFMWIVGASLSISFEKRRLRGDSPRGMLFGLARRSVLLFFLGLLLNFLPVAIETDFGSMASFQIMGTLQRISIAYFIAGIALLLTPVSRSPLIPAGIVLAAYSVLLFLVSAPGFARGDFSPQGNVASFLDPVFLGQHSTRSHPLFSAFAASATVLLGSVTGRLLISQATTVRKIWVMTFSGALLFIGGYLLRHWIPIIMWIWTPSYTLLMGGIATLSYAVVYWLLEIKGIRRATKLFIILGMNPIAIWVASGVYGTLIRAKGVIGEDNQWRSLGTLAYEKAFLVWASPGVASLAFAITHLCIFSSLAYGLYKRRWIIRV